MQTRADGRLAKRRLALPSLRLGVQDEELLGRLLKLEVASIGTKACPRAGRRTSAFIVRVPRVAWPLDRLCVGHLGHGGLTVATRASFPGVMNAGRMKGDGPDVGCSSDVSASAF